MSDVFILAFCQLDDCVLPCIKFSNKVHEPNSNDNITQSTLSFKIKELKNSSLKINQNSSEIEKSPDAVLPSSNSDPDGNNVSLEKDQSSDHGSSLTSNTKITKSATPKCNESDNVPPTNDDKNIRVADEYSSTILNNGELLNCTSTKTLSD